MQCQFVKIILKLSFRIINTSSRSKCVLCLVRCECDVEITPGTGPECINVPIPPNDRQYKSDPERTKTCFTTERSLAVANSEHCEYYVKIQTFDKHFAVWNCKRKESLRGPCSIWSHCK